MYGLLEWALRQLVNPAFLWLSFAVLFLIRVRRKSFRSSRVLVSLFVLYSLILASPFALYIASRPLENFALEKFKYADASIRDEIPCSEYAGVIALGGVIPNSEFNARNGIQLTAGAERVTEPVLLLQICPDFRLVWSSFGKSNDEGTGESELAREFWVSLGVPKSKIIIENGSTNTRENAIETLEILGNEKRWLLVSSAAHLKRAYATFTKVGLKVDPIPVDYMFVERPAIWSITPLSSVPGWQGIIHEYVGGIYYSLRDWI
jgi:uncharacterized SAM-binding protein YcdF (DUF218 family)